MPDSAFYLGRYTDDQQPVHYDPANLNTHAVIIGMTGSGKTGLLIALLEEAARGQGLPAIVIDPKGDLTNLLLHFPELRPENFAPWVDPEEARRAGVTPEALAASTAERWRKGLAGWDLGPQQIAALRDAVDYTVFTPGSTAGMPVNLLSSFAAPEQGMGGGVTEADRERIASTVTALLGLVGMTDVDPLRSREHILLANIFEFAWSQGRSLDLPALIEQVTAPSFDRLGAFPLERFFPEKDRFELAMLLNNFLAAPSFQSWLEGQPLDAGQLLYRADGKPRFSIFYLAHLGENERMFFVTLLLAAVEGWMRSQRGTSGVRALLAFDEIVGYLPPVANPPSRPVLLRLLKQGRAFGLGLVLATQNPTDINYKALSNAGTWCIGRLQTERDKERLLDGLQSLEAGIDRAAFDQMIAALKQRMFLLHNIHTPAPRVFSTRWTLNYLAGPLTRAQLPALRALHAQPAAGQYKATMADNLLQKEAPRAAKAAPTAGSTPVPQGVSSAPAPSPVPHPTPPVRAQVLAPARNGYTTAKPTAAAGTNEYFLPPGLSLQRALAVTGGALRGPLEPQGLLYRPALLAQAEIRYLNRRYGLHYARKLASLVPSPDLTPEWDAFSRPPLDPSLLGSVPPPGALFAPLPSSLATGRNISALQKDFLEWAYRAGTIYVRANEALKVYAGPDISGERFRRQVETAAQDGMQAEIDRTAALFDGKLDALGRRIERQQLSVDRRESAFGQRKAEQTASDFELVTSIFTRRKRSVSASLSRRRMTQQAKGELEDAQKVLSGLQAEWKSLADERHAALQKIQSDWQERAAQVTQIPVNPLKKDVAVELFGIAWLPYYLVKNPDGMIELAGI